MDLVESLLERPGFSFVLVDHPKGQG